MAFWLIFLAFAVLLKGSQGTMKLCSITPIDSNSSAKEWYVVKGSEIDVDLICKKESPRVVLFDKTTYGCGDVIEVERGVLKDVFMGLEWGKTAFSRILHGEENHTLDQLGEDEANASNATAEEYMYDFDEVMSNKTAEDAQIDRRDNVYLLVLSIMNCHVANSSDEPRHVLLQWDDVEVKKASESPLVAIKNYKPLSEVIVKGICSNHHDLELFVSMFNYPPDKTIPDVLHRLEVVDYLRWIEFHHLCDKVVALNYYKVVLDAPKKQRPSMGHFGDRPRSTGKSRTSAAVGTVWRGRALMNYSGLTLVLLAHSVK